MSSISFGSGNRGFQIGNNNGTINISSDRQETSQQEEMDKGLLSSLAFPQMLDRRENIEACHAHTCQWILKRKEYRSWTDRPCGLLWIKGKPGAGKSTLMVFLHDRLKEFQDGRRLEFFFTARGAELQRTPLGMFRSLLNQIFDCDTTIRHQMRTIYEKRCRQFGYGEHKWEWPQRVLEELLDSTILSSAKVQQITIFVDALDETGAESAQYLASYFHRLINCAAEKKLALKVCISCRHYPIVESAQALTIHVEDHNHEDIARYIKDTLIKTEVGDNFHQITREILAKELTQYAKGVFQWACLVTPFVKRKLSEGESLNRIRSWLHKIPAGLEDVYTHILSNVIRPENWDQSLLFFQWVCLAERPLTILELRYALAASDSQATPFRTRWEKLDNFVESNEHMTRRINALAGGLAEIVWSGGNETVQVVHQSVNDFLRTKGLALLYQSISTSRGSIDMDNILPQCQASLYRSCLVYLTNLFPSQCLGGLQGSIIDHVQNYPFLAYATINLFIHAEKATGSRLGLLNDEKTILQQMIGPWAQMYRHLDGFSAGCPPEGTGILHVAAAANMVDMIISLLSDGEDTERKDKLGNTALHLAARTGHTTAGKILREKGANREAKSNDGATPLIEAARYGRLEFVEWLLDKGVEIDAVGGAALQDASSKGHREMVEFLLGAGADVNSQGGQYGNALQAAVYNGRTIIVMILLQAHADINAQGGEHNSSLQASCFQGNVQIVQILLDHGANANIQGGYYGNTLQAICARGNVQIVQILLDRGADVNFQGGFYRNALYVASVKGHSQVVRILLDYGANVNIQGGYYGNALQAACAIGDVHTVQILLDHGANVNVQGGYYGNALQVTCAIGHTQIIQILLDFGADITANGGYFGTALEAACARGHQETTQVLLKYGADINQEGSYYGNALQAASSGGYDLIVQILLSRGADINAQGGHHGNALQAASSGGYDNIVQMLLK